MKAEFRPRRTYHSGFVVAGGFWLDPALIGADRMAGRILSLWREGCVMHAAADGVLVVLPSPARVESRSGPGVVLTRQDGLLVGFPLTKAEAARLDPPPGSALLCREGRVRVCRLSRETILDPAAWLDMPGLTARPSRPLGDPPAPAAMNRGIEPAPLESHFDPELTRPPKEKAAFLSALAKALAKKDKRARHEEQDPRNGGDRWPERSPGGLGLDRILGLGRAIVFLLATTSGVILLIWLASGGGVRIIGLLIGLIITRLLTRRGQGSLFPSLERFFSWVSGSGKSRPAARRASVPKPSPLRRPRQASWLSRGFDAARGFFGSMVGNSPAARLLGRRQARYLHRMTSMFEENDLDDALRHAIPLASLSQVARATRSLFRPKPRADLSVGLRPSGGPVRVIPLSGDYQQYLMELYRQACARLERSGEIEKAAFVLLELLQSNEEAIALLERHHRFRFAAEIAQARGLPPGMVIRLWFLAGEPAQAVRVARTTGAFSDAVMRLERTHPPEAAKLRLIWAGTLAEAGNYGAAVDAAWRIPEAGRLLLEWIERGIRLEGAIAARLIVKKIALDPGSFESVLPKIREILHDTLPGGLRAKLSLGKAILEHADRPDLRVLSGFVLRELLKGLHAVPFNPGFESVVRGLKGITPDRVLVEDLPAHEFPIPAAGPGGCLTFRRDAADVGLHRLYDGVCLPSGRLVVALGEAGVQVLSRRGALIAHLDCPADRLVLNDSGNRAIALARRGGVCRLARIDLETLREHYWCDALIDNAADTYDGEVWFASHEDTLMAVDAFSDRFESIWQVNDLKGPVRAMARNPAALSLLIDVPGEPEHWRYEVPSMTLRQRYGVFKQDDLVGGWAVMPKDYYGICRSRPAETADERDRFFVRIGTSDKKAAWQSREFEEVPASFGIYDHVCAVTTGTTEGRRILFFRWPGPTAEPALQLDLVGAGSAAVRRYANTFCVTDDCGRLLVMSPEDLRLIREAKL